MRTAQLVGIEEINDARARLKDVVVETPLDGSRALSEIAGGKVLIKCENLQRTGSFKIRGAFNRISRLSHDQKGKGVVAASAGNHAQGVALAASLSGTHSTVFMPESASLPKVEATRRYGAEVILSGKDFGAAFDEALEWAEAHGAVLIHPFDHPDVIAGQGTVGAEIHEQVDSIGTVVVPVGGGGLISGVAAALRSLRPSIRVVGVQAEGAAAYPPSLAKGSPVTIADMATVADGIAANAPGDLTFAHVQQLVDDVVCVNDEAIAEALVLSAERMKLVLEPAGATAVAAVMEGLGDLVPPVVVILSGGNIDPLLLLRVIRFGMCSSGRYYSFQTRMADRPGELNRMLGLLTELGANIVGINHQREGSTMGLGDVDVRLQIETKGHTHIELVVTRLREAGYSVEPA